MDKHERSQQGRPLARGAFLMPKANRKPCCNAGCNQLTHNSYCDKHKTKKWMRRTADSAKRQAMYNTKSWRVVRKIHLNNNPLCVECEKLHRVVLATVVDHITPHRGDQALFDDQTNYQSLCKPCHDQKTARGE